MGYFKKLFSQSVFGKSRPNTIEPQFFKRTGEIIDNGITDYPNGLGGRMNAKPDFWEIERDSFGNSPFVYIVTNRIAELVSSIEPIFTDNQGEQIEQDQIDRNSELLTLQSLLKKPNVNNSFKDFIYKLALSKMVNGNGYVVGTGLPNQKYIELIVPRSSQVTITEDAVDSIQSYDISYYQRSIQAMPKDVLHLHYPNITEEIHEGNSPLQSLRTIWRATNAINLNEQFIHQRKGVNGIVSDMSKRALTPQEQATQQRMVNSMKSQDVAGGVKFSPTELKYLELGKPPKDLMSNESLLSHLRIICNAYNAPSVLFGDSELGTYNSREQAYKWFYLDSILPLTHYIYKGLTEWLIKENYGLTDVNLSFNKKDIDAINVIDSVHTDKLLKEIQSGIITPNEARQILYPELEPLENETQGTQGAD